MDDLSKIESLLVELAGSWHKLGLLLGFSKDTLKLIASVSADPRVHLNRLLSRWISGDFDSPTVAVLVKALTTMSGTEDIIRNILEGIAFYLAYHCSTFFLLLPLTRTPWDMGQLS